MSVPDPGRSPNRLAKEKSPYLLQHAYNPVDWYPWGEEGFSKARSEDKPVFLSIGYSTCHWCHVMERESFEDSAIAALLNEFYVPIKVDREERPDVDRIYMTALQAMGQGGGWPMSMFLTPGLQPFYGGTYFPPETRHGRAGFPDLLKRIHHVWTTEREKVNESAQTITVFLEDVSHGGGAQGELGAEVMDLCYTQLTASYDEVSGGFGGGPKFPRPVVFEFLLRYQHVKGNQAAGEMVEHTLRSMAAGGMYDHIGGGFHRYSVDREWRVPHFEKMLYDQAQIVQSLLSAYLLSRDSSLAMIARETLDYVVRDMTDPAGGFHSAEDADSADPDNPRESREGGFYAWTKKEIAGLLKNDTDLFCHRFGVEEGGNVPLDPQHEFTGKNILYQAHALQETAQRFSLDEAEAESRLKAARERLLKARANRPPPFRDDKVLTSWNGLMIGALARGWRVLRGEKYGKAAQRAADFVLSNLYDEKTKRLWRRYRTGDVGIEAHLDDYAFFVSGLLDLYEASGEDRWIIAAVTLTEIQIELFLDNEEGGFFDTSGRDPSVLVRMKEKYDGAEPTGNSVAALNLIRLSRLLDRPEWAVLAEKTIMYFGKELKNQPIVLPLLTAALGMLRSTPLEAVIAGPRGDPVVEEMVGCLYEQYMPTMSIIHIDASKEDGIGNFNGFAGKLGMVGGKPTAYVCSDFACDLPVTDVAQLRQKLHG